MPKTLSRPKVLLPEADRKYGDEKASEVAPLRGALRIPCRIPSVMMPSPATWQPLTKESITAPTVRAQADRGR